MNQRYQSLSDEELVREYTMSDRKELVGELFKRHSLLCFTVCRKYLKSDDQALDESMNIFEKLFTDLKKHPVHNFRSWLHTVSRNHCLMLLRKPVRELRLEEEFISDNLMESSAFGHPNSVEELTEDQLTLLDTAIRSLNEAQSRCIGLFYLEGRSYEEISQTTGFTFKEVKSHIQNGKRNLKIRLTQNGYFSTLILLLWMHPFA